MILPYANTAAMNLYLLELGARIAPGRHAAILIDNAGWHQSKDLVVPENITLIPLPPYSPELNGMEQVWEWIKKHHLSYQCYTSYEHIVDQAAAAWNAFSANLELVKSVIHRYWINLPC